MTVNIYTIPEVMQILRLGKSTLYKHIRNGDIRAVKVGREWRISETAIKEFMGDIPRASSNIQQIIDVQCDD